MNRKPIAIRFFHLCNRINNLVDATRLWNWIDNQEQPEMYWRYMCHAMPWAFRDPSNANTMKFTY